MYKTGLLFVSMGLLLLALRRLLAHQTMQEAEAGAATTLAPTDAGAAMTDPPPEQLVLDAGLPTWQPL